MWCSTRRSGCPRTPSLPASPTCRSGPPSTGSWPSRATCARSPTRTSPPSERRSPPPARAELQEAAQLARLLVDPVELPLGILHQPGGQGPGPVRFGIGDRFHRRGEPLDEGLHRFGRGARGQLGPVGGGFLPAPRRGLGPAAGGGRRLGFRLSAGKLVGVA